MFVRGRALNENLQPHEAHALFQQAVDLDTAFALGYYALASTAPTAKDLTRHLAKAVERAARVSAGERLLILTLQARSNSDPEGARRLAEALVEQYPNDERAHWTLASACSAQQLYSRTIAELRRAIELNPQYSLAYNQLGYAYRSAGQMAAAETTFQRYIALAPTDPNPYDSYAELLMKLGRFDESIGQYRKALALDEHFTGSFVGIAANEMLAGRHGAAVAESERYFSVARDDRERRAALLILAMVYVDQGTTAKALGTMERRYDIARATGDTVNMSGDGLLIADILLAAGRTAEARVRFAQAHRLLANSSAAEELKRDDALGQHYDVARLSLAQRDLTTARAEADAYASEAVVRKNDARIRQAHELNAMVALSANRFDESLSELAHADQQNPAVLALMARAHAGRGDSLSAQTFADRARHMNILPTFPYVFTRATRPVATPLVTSRSAVGTPR